MYLSSYIPKAQKQLKKALRGKKKIRVIETRLYTNICIRYG